MDATARTAVRPTVTGYLDAITGSRIFGWAWDPERADARIAIRFEAAGEIVAAMIADGKREDLVASGVGDGGHAFEAALPDGVDAKALRVLAVCPHSGETVELHPRGVVQEAMPANDVQAAIQALVRSQRVLHRNINQIMLRVEEMRPSAPVASASDTSPDLRKQLEGIEVFMVRVDELLRDQASAALRIKDAGYDRIARALSGVAAVLAGVAALAALLH